MMRKQLELATTEMENEPENFGPNIKSIKFLGSGVKTKVGRVSGNNQNFFRPKPRSHGNHKPVETIQRIHAGLCVGVQISQTWPPVHFDTS